MSRQDFDDDEDEEEDEDIDALIDELESQDGDNADYEEEEADQPGGARVIPEELLQTDTRMGLNSAEVLLRRKKFGYNQLKGSWKLDLEELFSDPYQRKRKNFLSSSSCFLLGPYSSSWKLLPFSLRVYKTGLTLALFVACCC
jgi:hypothetical protein